MWKIAIAVMLLATSAFGGVTLTVSPADGKLTMDATTRTVSFTMGLDITGTDKVNGFSLATLSPPNKIQVSAVSYPGTPITDANVPGTVGMILDDQGVLDFGATAAAGQYATLTSTGGHVDVITLTLQVLPGVVVDQANPLMTDWYMFPTINDQAAEFAPVTLTITPEPASMLLVAAGAAFFARRRRA